MSRILNDILGRNCRIWFKNPAGEIESLKCRVLDSDGEWIRVRYVAVEGQHAQVMLLRHDNIETIEILS